MKAIDVLIDYSRKYGADAALVNAGGGNTSAKDGDVMYVKCSGTALKDAGPDSFARMDLAALRSILTRKYPDTDREREAAFLADIMAARCPGEQNKRPSVETLLHAIFPQKYVLHLHPALVNGLTCSRGGQVLAREIFGEDVVWIPACRPGYILAMLMNDRFRSSHKEINVVLLENHGVFFAADSAEQLAALLDDMMSRLSARIRQQPDVVTDAPDPGYGERLARLGGFDCWHFIGGCSSAEFAADREAARDMMTPFDPDQVVYCGAAAQFIDDVDKVSSIAAKVVIVRGVGFYTFGKDAKSARNAMLLTADSMKIAVYARSFGGAAHLSDELVDFLVHWEAESYRQKV